MSAASPDHVAERPSISRTSAGAIVVELSGPHAVVLAEILARYDALRGAIPTLEPIADYTPAVWHHTMLKLLIEHARLGRRVAEVVEVDVSLIRALEDGDVAADAGLRSVR